ncbi:hypothetical protein [Spiroplasma endosymbiont of Apeira syringaria]|uniref:hypothetical protein n=1 Tax=Spiroplasma endosymbiont of Apeira syringaria TaxID=3066307 RepID=UPI0030CA8149
MQDIAVQFEKHCWIHSVSLFPPQVHVGRSPLNILFAQNKPIIFNEINIKNIPIFFVYDISQFLLHQLILVQILLNILKALLLIVAIHPILTFLFSFSIYIFLYCTLFY